MIRWSSTSVQLPFVSHHGGAVVVSWALRLVVALVGFLALTGFPLPERSCRLGAQRIHQIVDVARGGLFRRCDRLALLLLFQQFLQRCLVVILEPNRLEMPRLRLQNML